MRAPKSHPWRDATAQVVSQRSGARKNGALRMDELHKRNEDDRALCSRVLALDTLTREQRDAFEAMHEHLRIRLDTLSDAQRAWLRDTLERNGECADETLNLVSSGEVKPGAYVPPAPVLLQRPLAPPGRAASQPNAMERRLAELRGRTS